MSERARSLGPAGSILFRKSISRHRLRRPRTAAMVCVDAIVERLDDNAVEIDQADEAERRGHLLGVVQFRRLAEVHRQAVVDQDVKVQVFFFHEQADEQTVEPAEEVPVEEAQIVADDVIAIVGEFDALALLAG